ncbi:MAG: autotransporter domain-containing protein [Alphaproteobacteria bacterium]|nr:autotransporter domain-containing protein [Alphaproteobacteria bacterium]
MGTRRQTGRAEFSSMPSLCICPGRGNARLAVARRTLLAGAAVVAPLTLGLLASNPAGAACVQVGQNVTCTDTTFNYNSGAQANLNVTVQAGAIVIGNNGNDAIRISSTTSATLTNNGTIDGFVTILSTVAGSDTFTNNGILKITDPTANLQEHSMVGTNFTQTANGTLYVRVDSNDFYDGIFSRSANLNGGLVVVVQPGLYGAQTTFTKVINTSTGTAGGFSSILTSSPFFTARTAVNADPNDLDVILTRVGFGSIPSMTPNQRAVGNALEGSYSTTLTGNAATLYSNLLAANSVTVLDNISGEGTSATQNAAFGAGSLFNNAMQGQGLFGPNGAINGLLPLPYAEPAKPRGHEAFAALKAPGKPQAGEPSRWRVWVAGFGASRGFDGQTSTGSSNQSVRNYGGALGVERNLSHDLTFGVAVGGSGSNFSVGNLSTTGRVTGGHIGAYAVKAWGAAYGAASLSYALFENDTRRTIVGVGTTETATGRFTSHQVGARIELGRRHALGPAAVTPFVAIEPAALWQQGYTETASGILGLSVASRTATSLPSFLGVQIDSRHTLSGGATIAPYARAPWVHEFLPNRRVTATFVSIPTATFTVDGARPATDAARIDAGAKLALRPGHAVFANFAGEWSSRTDSYSATGGYRATW